MPVKTLMAVVGIFLILTAGCAAKKKAVDAPDPKVKAEATKAQTTMPAAKIAAPVEQKAEKAETPPKKKAEAPAPQKPPRAKAAEAFDDWITVLNRELEKPAPAAVPPAEKVMKGEAVGYKSIKKDSLKPAAIKIKALKVKVLGGDGKLASAKAMSNRLVKMGYKVAAVGAASKTYTKTTIIYGPSYDKSAADLAAKLGEGTVLMPMDWKSDFHLIVVTGK